MKGCELCGKAARMYCESDDASLCWDCDSKVHSANFLVAKHCRTLLCRTCQSPTPWKASGSNLGPTVSACYSCFSSHCHSNVHEEQEQESQSEEEMFEDEDDDDDDVEEEEDGENQVVPWSEMGSSLPDGMSGESSDEEVSSGSFKRVRANSPHLYSDDEIGCSSSHQGYGRYMSNEEGTSYLSHNNGNQLKRARISEDDNEEENHGDKGSKSNSSAAVIIDSLKRFQREMVSDEQKSASATILGICKLSRDQSL